MRRLFILAPLALAACATRVDGPTRLMGQQLDAATGLYGPWAAEIERGGRPVYIWRRSVKLSNGENRSCELRVSLGFRKAIRSAVLEGFEDACHLYDVRYENLTR
jgi:hypothetical protein